MTERDTQKKDYKPAELVIVVVDQTDIICTSGGYIMPLEDGGDL